MVAKEVTRQFANKPTRCQSNHGQVNSQNGGVNLFDGKFRVNNFSAAIFKNLLSVID